MKKIYCFVDETGQDTKGKSFHIVVVIIEGRAVELIRKSLIVVESKTSKGFKKWGRTDLNTRKTYIGQTTSLIKGGGHIFYAVFHNSKEYVALTAFALVQAILSYSDKKVECSIIIYGLKESDQKKTLSVIKNFHIRYRKVRGLKDQSEPILRLADSIAGLVRDEDEGESYAEGLLQKLKNGGIISQIKK